MSDREIRLIESYLRPRSRMGYESGASRGRHFPIAAFLPHHSNRIITMNHRLFFLVATLFPAPLQAQGIVPEPLSSGVDHSSEVAVSLPFDTEAGAVFDGGGAVVFRRQGRLNLAIRLVHVAGVGQHSSAELGTFRRLPPIKGVRWGWSAGIGQDSGRRGVFIPLGVDLSRELRSGSWHARPYLHLGASLDGIAPESGHGGDLVPVAEVGADLGIQSGWSIRVAIGSPHRGGRTIGVVRRW